MRERFKEDLEQVKSISKEIMAYVSSSYDKLSQYIEKSDEAILKDILDIKEDIRRKATSLERLSYELMALQQPVAKDLKLLQMAMKLASSYKRIGGHFEQISLILMEYSLNDSEKDYVNKLIENEKKMAIDSIDSFIKIDKDLARKTIEADKINNDLFKEAVEFIARENKNDLISPVELAEKVLLYKYFERLGDRLARVGDLATRL